MGGQLGQRLGEVEIVGKFRAVILLAVAHLGGEAATLPIDVAQAAQQLRVLGKTFDQNGAGALKCRLRSGNLFFGIHESTRSLLRVTGRLFQEQVGQRLQPGLLGDLRFGAPLRLVGEIKILKPGLGVGGVDLERQLVGKLALLADAVEDRLATGL
ncbi:MAG: hypothetical protein K0S42_920 [Microvirga sp.]|nr:hypothetical protein [Microvirga sp.]